MADLNGKSDTTLGIDDDMLDIQQNDENGNGASLNTNKPKPKLSEEIDQASKEKDKTPPYSTNNKTDNDHKEKAEQDGIVGQVETNKKIPNILDKNMEQPKHAGELPENGEKNQAQAVEIKHEPKKVAASIGTQANANKHEPLHFVTADISGTVKIRDDVEGSIASEPTKSVMEFMEEMIKKIPRCEALRMEKPDGDWAVWTYEKYLQDVKIIAKAFITIGLEQCDSVGILGKNSPEWVLAAVGAIFAGGLATGIDSSSEQEICKRICLNAECSILVVGDDSQFEKIWNVRELLNLKAIIHITDNKHPTKKEDLKVYSWKEFKSKGQDVQSDLESQRDEKSSNLKKHMSPNKCCTLVYDNNIQDGVMLSHDNIIQTCKGVVERLTSGTSGLNVANDANRTKQEHCVCYLPLNHAVSQIMNIWMPMSIGACVWFPRSGEGSVGKILRSSKATLFLGDPAAFQRIEEKLKSTDESIHGIKRQIGIWARGIALEGNQNKENRKPVPFGWTLANTLFIDQVRAAIGLDRMKMIFSATGSLSKDTFEYYQSINLPIYEIYGTSESSGILTMCSPSKVRTNSVGCLLSICESKIDDDDKNVLWFYGRNIMMGYLKNLERTNTIITEGWLHSEDIHRVHDDIFYTRVNTKENLPPNSKDISVEDSTNQRGITSPVINIEQEGATTAHVGNTEQEGATTAHVGNAEQNAEQGKLYAGVSTTDHLQQKSPET